MENVSARMPHRSTRRWAKWTLRGLGAAAGLVLLAYLGVGALAASQLTLPQRVFDPSLGPARYGLQFEEVRLPARTDGLEIAAWHLPSTANERAIILVHGRDNSRTNGFVDHFVEFAGSLQRAGFSVMMIDLRGHGQSAGARYTFGIKERQDILGAVDWLVSRGYAPTRIGALGYSLGAASVIGAAADEPAIGAIWIDSAYADVQPVIEGGWRANSGLPQVLLYPTEWMIRVLYGYDITASRPVQEIGRIAPRPIFMAHCQQDAMIPISHMEQLRAVVPQAETWVILNCDQHTLVQPIVPEKYNNHALGFNLQPEEYTRRVIAFFDEALR
ncbi:MAG: alpha/beta hydrolase [Bacteroidota bacterium]